MTTEEKIKLMQAYVDGAEIEYQGLSRTSSWSQTKDPSWEWFTTDFRIKAKPKILYYYESPNGEVALAVSGTRISEDWAKVGWELIKSETL